jgi:hypothetical protein
LGALGNVDAPANSVYGDFRNPNELGSGGASESGAGGNGGGLVQLDAATLTLDGEIAADGGEGLGNLAAGGSGGALRLDVGMLSGGGRIHANGGRRDQLDKRRRWRRASRSTTSLRSTSHGEALGGLSPGNLHGGSAPPSRRSNGGRHRQCRPLRCVHAARLAGGVPAPH